ncbi:S41 family peptidase [Caulobacter sp. NIBR2454]|uniref:S41 family peptidase n=1 Tax=Caulobacter sp. NIBR2454 TaxID=3015996 RepID=UPI0022B66AD3|nr:S41 family peptidase [Caulobacter sp. NIBR2454]
MSVAIRAVVLAASLCFSGVAMAHERDWGAALRSDADAMRRIYNESHPGAVDPANPEFNKQLTDIHAAAYARSHTVRNQADYELGVRAMGAAFNDGHAGTYPSRQLPKLTNYWTGFVLRSVNGELRVALREDGAAPPLDARLMSCDGIAADRLYEQRVGTYNPLFSLEARRARLGGRLLLQYGEPSLDDRPKRCIFQQGTESKSYDLTWRPHPDIGPLLTKAAQSFVAPIERRVLPDGTIWISAGTFNNIPGSDVSTRLANLVSSIEHDPSLRDAPRVVLDVRGNGGGDSLWSYRMAQALFGADYVEAVAPASEGIDWRPSSDNIAHFERLLEGWRKEAEPNTQSIEWVTKVLAGMKAAKASGATFWREIDAPRTKSSSALRSQYAGRAIVLVDGACGSACLDAVDVWKAAGAVLVGRETAADSLYMDVRYETLPSGMATLAIPTKVYRGRQRGSNEPYRPDHVWNGGMNDTPALEKWIVALP